MADERARATSRKRRLNAVARKHLRAGEQSSERVRKSRVVARLLELIAALLDGRREQTANARAKAAASHVVKTARRMLASVQPVGVRLRRRRVVAAIAYSRAGASARQRLQATITTTSDGRRATDNERRQHKTRDSPFLCVGRIFVAVFIC